MCYDPLQPPDPAAWLALGEQERIDLVLAYHHSIGDRGENEQLHCLLHAIVENQVAMGERFPVAEKIRQLMAQGLDRHHAVHAICIVLASHMRRLSQRGGEGDDERRYFSEVRRQTARKYMMALDHAFGRNGHRQESSLGD
jgi:hypothetical protein